MNCPVVTLPAREPEKHPAPTLRLSGRRLWATLGLTTALLALLFTQVSFRATATMLRTANPRLFALGCLAFVASYVGRTVRWQFLTPSCHVPWGALYGITAVHSFTLRALPSKLGEGVYLVMMRAQGVTGTEALASLVVGRVYDLAAAVAFFLFSIFFAGLRLHHSLAANLAAGLAVLLLCALVVLRGSLLVRFTNALAARVAAQPWMPRGILGRGVRRSLVRMEKELEGIQSARHAPLLLLSTIAIWLPSYLMFYWLVHSFGAPFGFWGTVFASTLSMVATFLPVGTFGNFGTTEAGWTVGLMLLGATRDQALATGFSTHMVALALAGLLALVGGPLFGWPVGGAADGGFSA